MTKSRHARRRFAGLLLAALSVGLTIAPSAADCDFTLTASPDEAAHGTPVLLEAKCLTDVFGAPVEGETIDFFVTPPFGLDPIDTLHAGTATTNADGDASVIWGDDPDETATPYGVYSATAESLLSRAGTTFTRTAPTAAASITTLTVPTAAVAAGNNAVLTAAGIKDAAGKAVAAGTPVTFTITPPVGSAFTLEAVSTGGDASDASSSASVTVPGLLHNTNAGSYSVVAAAGTGTKSGSYTVSGSLPTDSVTMTFNASQSIGTELEVVLSGLALDTGTAALQVRRPQGNPVSLSANSVLGEATFRLTPAQLLYVGTYTLAAGARNVATNALTAYSTGTFTATTGALDVSAPDVDLGDGNIISIKNTPANAVELEITITKPLGGTITPDPIATPAASEEFVQISAADLDEAGEYTIAAHATGAGGGTVAGGAGAFRVRPPLGVSAPGVILGSGNSVEITAIPAGTATIELAVSKPSGASVTKTQASGGPTDTVALTAADLDEAGLYLLTARARDASDNWTATGLGAFVVTGPILGLFISPESVVVPQSPVDITVEYTLVGSPLAGVQMDLRVIDPLGRQIIERSRTTSASGRWTFRTAPLDTTLPGAYTVVVTALDSYGSETSGIFTVIAG